MQNRDSILRRVEKPSRYTGNEWNVSQKKFSDCRLRILLIYPDLYEIGMSNLSLRILYQIISEIDGVFCDRAFIPATDMWEIMEDEKISLWGLSSGQPANSFDIIAFTVQHELLYSNIVHTLKLADIPAQRDKRTQNHPLIIAGGPSIVNPEPLAGIIDVFHLGEAENAIHDIIQSCLGKEKDFGKALKGIPGLYFPEDYEFQFEKERIISISPEQKITKNIVKDLDQVQVNLKDIVPFSSIVHDRCILEIQRGCDFGCRFCLAGFIYRPRRERSTELLASQARQVLANTGWEELSLSSLSSLCHSGLENLVQELLPELKEKRINLSLPSLRINSKSFSIFKKLSGLRKSGVTLVPEAGSDFIRKFINKNVSEQELITTAEKVINEGWKNIKLYFMIGFSPESDEDVNAIADFSMKILSMGKKVHKNRFSLSVSVASFVPKPHTPFQWERFEAVDTLKARIKLLNTRLRDRCLKFSYHDFSSSRLEAMLARGDRRLSNVIIKACELGARFDSWDQHFRPDLWEQAFRECNLDPSWFTRERSLDEILPWDRTDFGITRDFLEKERELAYKFEQSPSCAEKCSACGVNSLL